MMTTVEMTVWALAYHDAVRDQHAYWDAEDLRADADHAMIRDQYRFITTRACERAALAVEDLRRVRVEDLTETSAQNQLIEVRHR